VSRALYLDHNATSPLRAEVRAAMVAAMESEDGNPSSLHGPGRRARDAVERARREVAHFLGALAEEVVFTSGGTEGDHLCVRGLARAGRRARGLAAPRVIACRIEHPAVLGALDELAGEGFAVTWLPVGATGTVSAADLRAALGDDVVLVTLAAANHELGTINPIAELAAAAHERGIPLHTDAVQAAGRLPFDVGAAGVDAATISAHKIGGPKGVGAVFVRRGVDLDPLLPGGHQERERRGGTENVVGIVGLAAACRAADPAQTGVRVAALRDRLEARLLAIPGARRHGTGPRVPGTCNLGFEGAPGHLVLVGLDLEGVAVSTGAACTSGTLAPSPALLALGLPDERAREAVRFSLGPELDEADVDRVAALTAAVVARVRAAADERGGPLGEAA
jgi:cysteine desulfurase